MSPQNYTPIDHLVKKMQEPKNPISLPREAGPAISTGEMLSLNETGEHEVNDEEVKPYVDINKEVVELDPELKKAGVNIVTHSEYPPYLTYSLPVSDEKVMEGLHKPISSSLRWLAELAIYLLRQSHIGLKKIHGKVVRIVRP